jgi:hypothetical protein
MVKEIAKAAINGDGKSLGNRDSKPSVQPGNVGLCQPMTTPTIPRSRGRTPKRVRSVEELAALARVFGADWHPGDNIMTWIRRHEGGVRELSKLVRDGWSWADVGRAMALAGIVYRTGTPIAAGILSNKAWLAREVDRRDKVREAARSALVTALPAAASVSAALRADRPDLPGIPDQESQSFPLVTFKAGHAPPLAPPAHPPPQEPSAEVADEEILRRVFGKP